MGPYRLIAIDFDGTLLGPDGKVSARVKAAVHRAADAGLLICFATGRNWTESRAVVEDVAHYDIAVFAGGAMVVDTRRGVTIHCVRMAPDLAAECSGFLEAAGHAVLALQDSGRASVDYLLTDEIPLVPSNQQWLSAMGVTLHRVPRLGSHPHPHTMRLHVVATRHEIERIAAALATRFAERITSHHVYSSTADMGVLEVFDPAVNKWQGVLHVARQHGITPEQIVAIGDEVNDLPMLTHAGLGVAMGNANPLVKQAARRVIGANYEDGLADFLDELARSHQNET